MTTAAFVPGERLYLREVRPSDVNETYYRWMNDPEVIRYLESRFRPNAVQTIRAYVEAHLKDQKDIFFAIVLKDKDRHIGNIKIGPIDWIHRTAEVGLIVGEKDCWGRGYATEAIRLVMRHAFQVLNLRRLTAGAYADNVGSIRAFEKAGFSREGVRRQHFFSGGRYVDGILLGVLREELEPR